LVVLTGLLAPQTSAFGNQGESEATIFNPAVIRLTTENSIRRPLDSFNISQGYRTFHRAIDLNEVTGAPVYPIADGKVKMASYGRVSYGNHVIVDHGSGFESLYAHLAKIVVKNGEAVDKNTVLGTVGATGLATGSHLHLEVYDHGQPFNPLTILK
jgi:murein DD-endopeptidase MepM/ murein hydrolase activator NlpD